MEGPSLIHVLGNPVMERMLFEVMEASVAVIACRVSPKQKAQLVRLVKESAVPIPVTLAIGDGANDVGMIQEAHVGVGISGNEGQQAVNASDFAIAQFRFLKRLLLVHGRWNYRRMSKVVLYSFYKNLVLVLTLFFYLFVSGFSGTSLYEDNMLAGYNFFLGLPILFLGLFDKDVTATYVMNHPKMYTSGRHNLDLNLSQTIKWIFKACYDGVLVYFACFAASSFSAADHDISSFYVYGMTVYSVLILTMDLKVRGSGDSGGSSSSDSGNDDDGEDDDDDGGISGTLILVIMPLYGNDDDYDDDHGDRFCKSSRPSPYHHSWPDGSPMRMAEV